MTVNDALRLVIGVAVLAGIAVGDWLTPYGYYFTAFVGLNLIQSAFTKWCPMMVVLRKMGLED